MSFLSDVIAATFRNATPLVYGTVGETYCERSGILNLGIEGTMYAGAFFGFLQFPIAIGQRLVVQRYLAQPFVQEPHPHAERGERGASERKQEAGADRKRVWVVAGGF